MSFAKKKSVSRLSSQTLMTTAINMAWRATIKPPVAATLRSLPDVIVVEPALFVLMSLEKSLVNPYALKEKEK